MKIHLDNVASFGTGPGTFAHRLAARFFESGHEVVFASEDSDISLVFIEPSGSPLAPKVVQRLDGIWFKPSEYKFKNDGILSLYKKANAVVLQSQFDLEMTNRWWGSPARREVIHNGIKIEPVKELSPAIASLRNQYKQIYVCSSNWHAQKRLKANIQLFQHLQRLEPSSCLIVMGKNPDFLVPGPHVFYTGLLRPEEYNQIYSAANWMLHLAWADHCPNVVIEALAQGTPVVCSSVGGTKELVGKYGFVLTDALYDFELADYDNPPELNNLQNITLFDRRDLDYSSIADINIDNVAQKYIDLFTDVIRN